MRYSLYWKEVLAAVLAVLLSSAQVSCSRIAWKEFSSEQGAFSVLFPGKPERQKETVETDLGQIELTMFITEIEQGAVFFVSYSDYPGHVVEQSEPYAILENSRDSTIRSQQGQLRQSYKLTLAGNPGLEYLADTRIEDRKALIWARCYLRKNRLFQILTMALTSGETPSEHHDEMDRFLQSFRFAGLVP